MRPATITGPPVKPPTAAIEVGIHHRLEPLRAQLFERRDIAEPALFTTTRDVQMWPPPSARRPERRLSFFPALIAGFQIVGALPSTGRVSSLPTFGRLDRKNSNPRSRAEMPLP
jgi:hypothetical protein